MRRSVTLLFAMFAGTSLAALAQSQSESLYKAKMGRPTPAEQNRLAAEAASTAFRDVTPGQQSFSEQWFRQKFGRYSPAEQARIDAENASTAFREAAPSRSDWTSDYMKSKLGR